MKTRASAILAAAVMAAVTAAPVAAQQGQGHGQGHQGHSMMMQSGPHGHAMMEGDHGHAMMAAMAFGPGPAMLLRQRDALELTEEQASRLDSLRAAMHSSMEDHRAGMQEIHQGMKTLADSEEPDMARFRELLEQMADSRVDLAVRMAEVHREAMDVLSPEQRSNARYGMELMHHRMMRMHHEEGGHGGMMERHPMMRERGQMERDVQMRKRIHRDTTGTGGGT